MAASAPDGIRHPGRLFVFEGPDGVGKSTLALALAQAIIEQGRQAVQLSFPGREEGTIGRAIYDVHHNPQHYGIREISPASRQILHIAAHADAIQRVILPRLHAGDDVVLDRFWWSTWVYGMTSGVNESVLDAMLSLEEECWEGLRPEAVFLVTREEPLRREQDHSEWRRLAELYARLARRESKSYPVLPIHNVDPLDHAMVHVWQHIQSITQSSEGRETYRGNSRRRGSRHEEEARQVDMPLFNPDPYEGVGRLSSAPGDRLLADWRPARPTKVFETYWRFAAERQSIFFKKLQGLRKPWTSDAILQKHKFTNAYRASDRVSQFLIKHVIYEGNRDPRETFFRIMLFKLFNKIETWQLLYERLGEITWRSYSFETYSAVLSSAMASGARIYSAAYMMPSARSAFGFARKHDNHLKLIESMMADSLPHRLASCGSMQEAFMLLRGYPTIGDFLAYQYVTDINYSEVTNFSEMEFVVPGPGAKDGICKCFADLGGLGEVEIIAEMAKHQEREFARFGLEFKGLWGRPLQLIDCQNLFCEVDKYARLAHPEIQGISGRTRVKQRYRPQGGPIEYWYPPKWGINEEVRRRA